HSQTVCGANTELIIHGGEEIGALRVRPDETALMNRSGTISDGKGIISVRGILETSGHCGVAAVADIGLAAAGGCCVRGADICVRSEERRVGKDSGARWGA